MALRQVVLASGLEETCKWGVPTYTYAEKNVAQIACFNDYASLNFFKGVLLDDPTGLLVAPGPNSKSDRIVRITQSGQVERLAPAVQQLLAGAIALERTGRRVEPEGPEELTFPPELLEKFTADPGFEQAFRSLTPGRQRGYTLHFAAPKQAKTRLSRIEASVPKILAGKGLHD
ncbi:MAG: YdeI/OmpD-associated family protein [Bacteroidia bacterium]|nr:YdeI/OmpD-associated family protein [Bacteroidia bacterium]